MLIWGWRSFAKTIGQGTFYSPAAGCDAEYRLVQLRRWFTFFFVPIIPLEVLGTYVECQRTRHKYDPAILKYPTNAKLYEQLAAAVREVVAAVAIADGRVTDEERRLALQTIGDYVPGYDEKTFEADISRVTSAPLEARLVFLAGTLDEGGKEQLLTAAARIKAADGVIDQCGYDALTSIGRSLSMTRAHVNGVIQTVLSPT